MVSKWAIRAGEAEGRRELPEATIADCHQVDASLC